MKAKGRVFFLGAAGAFAASFASAQGADFSGRWKVAPPLTAAGATQGTAPPTLSEPGNMGSGWTSEITLTQDAKDLTVECAYFHPRDIQPPVRYVYSLAGESTRNTVDLGLGAQVQVSKAGWDGARLVITTTHTFVNPRDGQTLTSETRQTLSLESEGTLTIETFRGAALGGRSSTTKTVYKRVAKQ